MKIKKISGTAVLDGNVVDNLSDNSSMNAPSQRAVNEEFTNVKGKILWTNPNPTSEFASQDIAFNSDDFDIYEVYYYISNANYQILTAKSLKGHGTRLMIPSSNMEYRLMTNNSDISYTFNAPSSDSYAIPICVVGYKIGLF